MKPIEIIKGTPDDYSDCEGVAREAFWNLYQPGCDEHYITHKIWSHKDFLPDYFYVAKQGESVVGFIVYTRSFIEDRTSQTLAETATFGPVCVLPQYQFQGIGSKLISTSVDKVQEDGFPAVIILGDPHNYCRHDFKNCKDYRVSDHEGRYPLGQLVKVLDNKFFMESIDAPESEARVWQCRISDVFESNMEEVEQFDQGFPAKEKRHEYSQDLFNMLIRAYVD